MWLKNTGENMPGYVAGSYAAIVAKNGDLGMSGFLDNSYLVAGCYIWLQVTIHSYYS